MEQNNTNKSNSNIVKSQTKFERYIISCMLNDANVIDDVLTKLTVDDFLDVKLRCIFQVIRDIQKQSKLVNNDTVIEYISKNKELSALIGDYNTLVCDLSYSYTTSINLKQYVDLVKEFSIKNQLDRFANQLINEQVDFTRFKNQSYD